MLACSSQTQRPAQQADSICPPTVSPERVLDAWHLAAAEAREQDYFDLLHENSVFLGTDASERWSKNEFRDYAHPHFAKGKAWSFVSERRNLLPTGSDHLVAFDEDLKTVGLGPARGSGLMIRENCGDWKILHYNLALTIPNEMFNAVRQLLDDEEEAASL